MQGPFHPGRIRLHVDLLERPNFLAGPAALLPVPRVVERVVQIDAQLEVRLSPPLPFVIGVVNDDPGPLEITDLGALIAARDLPPTLSSKLLTVLRHHRDIDRRRRRRVADLERERRRGLPAAAGAATTGAATAGTAAARAAAARTAASGLSLRRPNKRRSHKASSKQNRHALHL